MTDDLFDDDDYDPASFDSDPNAAKRARDEALKKVRENGGNWRDKAFVGLRLLQGYEGTAEDIRIRLKMKGLEKPHHHNAWGEMIKAAIKMRRILPTGEHRHMKTEKSHARKTPVYRVL